MGNETTDRIPTAAVMQKGRSRRVGPGHHQCHTNAFVSLERMGGIFVFDISKPQTPEDVQAMETATARKEEYNTHAPVLPLAFECGA